MALGSILGLTRFDGADDECNGGARADSTALADVLTTAGGSGTTLGFAAAVADALTFCCEGAAAGAGSAGCSFPVRSVSHKASGSASTPIPASGQ